MKTKIKPGNKDKILSLVILSLVFAGCGNPDDSDNNNDDQYNFKYPAPSIDSFGVVGMEEALEIRWTKIDEESVTGYEVYYGTADSFDAAAKWPEPITQPKESNLVTVTIKGLVNNTLYYVWALTVYVDGRSYPCEAGSGKPRPKPALAPSFTTYSDDEAIGIKWDIPVTDADSYVVYYDTYLIDDTPSDTVSKAEFSGADSCDVMALIKGLTNDTTYHIRMSSKNTSGETPLSIEKTEMPKVNTNTPDKPDGPVRVMSGNKSLSLQWLPVRYAKSYNIYYDTSSSVTTASPHISAVSGYGKLSAKITDLTNGTPYYICITAVNGSNESLLSHSNNNTPQSKPSLNMTNYNFIIGTAGEYFPNEEAGHGDRLSRKKETAFGDLTGDALIYWARKHKADYGYEDVDFAIYNGGVIQSGLGEGPITVGLIRTTYYSDPMTILTLTGEEILELFNKRVATVPHSGGGGTGTGAFGQVSAEVHFTLNYHNTRSEGTIDSLQIYKNGVWQNLKDGTHNSEQYRIITSTYLVNGGDGYGTYFVGATARKDTGKLIAEATADYIYDQDGIPIVPYIDGRLTLVGELWQ